MRGFGELEQVIMDRMWARGEACTVRDILTELLTGRPLAYTTVLTVMDNLYKKGWLRRERDGRAHRYIPVVSRGEYGAGLMREVLDATGDTSAALTKFVDQLTPKQAATLRAGLDAREQSP